MATYTIRWMGYGPRPVKPEEVLAVLRAALPGWTFGTANIATVTARGAATGAADRESGLAEGQITGPDGWGTTASETPATLAAITTGSGVTVEASTSDTLSTDQRRNLQRALNGSADTILRPAGLVGDNRGWRLRAVGEAETSYPALVAPAGTNWFPLLAVAVFAGAAYFYSREKA